MTMSTASSKRLAWGWAGLLAAAACSGSGSPAEPRITAAADRPAGPPVVLPRTESPRIALANLAGRIRGVEARLHRHPADGGLRAAAIELRLERHRFLGDPADLTAAEAMARAWIALADQAPAAHLAAARVTSAQHRFTEAAAHLDRAAALGAATAQLLPLRGDLAEGAHDRAAALTLRRRAATLRPSILSLGLLAAMLAEDGDHTGAELTFRRALAAYRGVSPFPLAWLCLHWGQARQRAGDLIGARALYLQALDRLPGYTAAAAALAALQPDHAR
jgi:tetratricopeptide (TPR) repeat protein